MIRVHGITAFVLGLLSLGLLLPLAAGMLISFSVEKGRLHQQLVEFQDNSLEALARSTRDALMSFSPGGAFNSANMLLNDARVVQVEVYSSIFGMHLVHIPLKSMDDTVQPRTRKKVLYNEGEELGYVSLTIDMGWGDPLVAREQRRALFLFGAIFLGAMSLVIPAFYYKIIGPMRRLTNQATRISRGDLDTPSRWQGRDEFSLLGRTLDTMRLRLKESFSRVQHLAQTDELTGIANRRAFFPKVQQHLEISKRYKKNLCIAILDIDFFKVINDTYGHAMGDDVLVEVAGIVSARIRSTDVFARFGGEEFILCMPETGLEAAHVLLEDIRAMVATHEFPHGDPVTVSIGLAQYEALQPLKELISLADKALYLAKSRNRNRVDVFERTL